MNAMLCSIVAVEEGFTVPVLIPLVLVLVDGDPVPDIAAPGARRGGGTSVAIFGELSAAESEDSSSLTSSPLPVCIDIEPGSGNTAEP
jgi:hypothetical protein